MCVPPVVVEPTFNPETAYSYFQKSFSDENSSYDGLPTWVADAMSPPSPITIEFDLSLIRPRDVKSTLKHCSSSSSPGEDGISYLHLRKMSRCHHFLATLYSKILLKPIMLLKTGAMGNSGSSQKEGILVNLATSDL